MKKILMLVLCGGLTASTVFADNNLWVDGKDRPNERVNVDLRSLSPDAFLRVAEKVDEAVVNISTTTVIKVPRGFQSPDGSRSNRHTTGRMISDDNLSPLLTSSLGTTSLNISLVVLKCLRPSSDNRAWDPGFC